MKKDNIDIYINKLKYFQKRTEFYVPRIAEDLYKELNEKNTEIDSLFYVKDSWGAFESDKPSFRSIEKAVEIINIGIDDYGLIPLRVLPSAEGGVAIIYAATKNFYIDIEIFNQQENYNNEDITIAAIISCSEIGKDGSLNKDLLHSWNIDDKEDCLTIAQSLLLISDAIRIYRR